MSTPASPSSADSAEERNAFKRFVKSVAHKGHRNLLIRGLCGAAHATLSLTLAIAGENRPVMLLNGICQIVASLTLIYQFRTANPHMFIARGLASWARVVIILHGAVCGGSNWPGGKCVTQAWSDVRAPLRVLACASALRMFLNGLSLMLQYKFPRRGVGQHGNEQLFYRGFVQSTGIPLHYMSAMLKMGELSNTEYERTALEIVVHFLRGFVIVPVAAWSLFDQWVGTGSGKKTDDLRTAHVGEKHPNATDKLTAKVSPHKGHRNLLIRCVASFLQGIQTLWLVAYDINRKPASLYMIAQFVGSLTLFIQWRTGNPRMFLARGSANWFACAVAIYHAKCGPTWPGETCKDGAWQDDRVSLRILGSCAAARLFFNGLSLLCQYKFPHRMFGGHGNEQLFYRGCVQATGIPIHIGRFFLKVLEFDGYPPMDYTVNLIRGLVLIPVSSASLFHQWKHTSPGNTGHPASALFEREKDPSINHVAERLRVTIISAKGLRKADITGSSDPYCFCAVVGRPESKFQTKFLSKTLEPEWNETQELPVYKHLDSLEFIVRDHDEESKVPCCKMFDDGDDLLGKVIVKSEEIHPNGFSGEVKLTHAGKAHKNAVINIKIELLGDKEKENPFTAILGKEAETIGGEAIQEVVKEVQEGVSAVESAVVTASRLVGKSEVEPDCARTGTPPQPRLVNGILVKEASI